MSLGGDQDRQQGALLRAAEVDGRAVDDEFDAAEHPHVHASHNRRTAVQVVRKQTSSGGHQSNEFDRRSGETAVTAEAPTGKIDTRDMNCVHVALRREFRLAPGLVREVGDNDTDRARTVADHVQFLTTLLHHHHTSEDVLLWPKLLARVPEELAPIVHLMEAQHARVGALLEQIERLRAHWGSTARTAEAEELAGLLDELYVALLEHLEAEEQRLLPIAARTVSQAEWNELGEAGVKKLRKRELPLVFGMIQYEGDPEVVAEIVAGTPVLIRMFVPPLSRRAFRRYALAVHGTATP
jgi:hemerythrin-like domain-containing protein